MTGVINSPGFGFTFGLLNLIGTAADLSANGYRFWVLDDDGDLGNPQAIEQTIQSWLQDGSIVAVQGYDNRELFIPVIIEGTDGTTLAAGEAALMLETSKRNTLTYQPADPTAPASVFTVITSVLEHVTRPASEVTNERAYGIRITAEPFTRATDQTVTVYPAPTGSATVTSLNITSSGTGWSGEVVDPDNTVHTPSLAISPPPIAVQASITTAGLTNVRAIKTGLSQSLSTTPYLRVTVNTILSTGVSISRFGYDFRVNNNPLTPVAQYGDNYWLDTSTLGAITMTDLLVGVSVGWAGGGGTGSATIRVTDVARADLIDSGATNRQISRTLDVGGSVRTEGNLLIADATTPSLSALGDVLVYTCPSFPGMSSPNLRQFLTSGNVTSTAASNVSGVSTDMSILHTFDIPADSLAPGGYLLMARLAAEPGSEGAQNITWAARSRLGSTNLANPQTGVSSITLATTYTIVTIADLVLPPHLMGSDGKVRIELTATASFTKLDDAWLFNIETGQLTQVACGTASPSAGGSASNLWLDAPTLTSPEPAIYVGTDADRSDSYEASAQAAAVGHHVYAPPSTVAFVVTTNSARADLTLTAYRRAHTHIPVA